MKGKEIAFTCLGVTLIAGGFIILTKFGNGDYHKVMSDAELALSKFRMLTNKGLG